MLESELQLYQGENSNEDSAFAADLESIDKFLLLLRPIAGVDGDKEDDVGLPWFLSPAF